MRADRMWERFSDENPPRWRALRTRIRIESTQALPVVCCLQQLLKASATGQPGSIRNIP